MTDVKYAFPLIGEVNASNANERFAVWNKGMTLHDYFAAKAMAAFIDIQGNGSGNLDYSNIAKDAYLLADAMVKTKAER